ncbi:MAG: VOC family protein [Chlorobiaceae bacterium]|nr:VOC family protein [Chlorobiaceae bacterium]
MAKQIFVNLPVKDLKKSIAFFASLGYSFEPRFTDDSAACMIVSEDIYVMLLTRELFKTFTPKELCDATKYTEVLVSISCESKEQVDDLVRKAITAGGSTYNEPKDYGFMYTHGYQDLDGHIWEIVYMLQENAEAKTKP